MKHKIDKYFEREYQNLYNLATARVMQTQRDYDGGVLVSNCYLYLLKKADKIPTEDDIELWARRYITTQAYWTNSETNKEELETHRNLVPYVYRDEVEIDEIEEKIKLEDWYNRKKAILELFRTKLRGEDKVKLIVLDKMIEEKTTTSRYIAEYYNVPHLEIWKYTKDIKRLLKKFEDDLNKYDNKNNL